MYSIGYDIGSSSIKCSILDVEQGKVIAQGFYPNDEMPIQSPQPGWAEQDPNLWWDYLVTLTRKIMKENSIDTSKIKAIGISYQMHGLVIVDKQHNVLRPSIIWCDSRAVEIGNDAFRKIGETYCLRHLLNSPGNFTASKLRWVRENESEIYKKIYKAMLPGEFIAMKMTGEISTTISGLSEGILWDFTTNSLSKKILSVYDIDPNILPEIKPTFSIQGVLTKSAANELALQEGIPISYRAGDQPSNAFSLNVLHPGEIAATAGTSGVVYGVSDSMRYDPKSRVNVFAHVNHTLDQTRLGILLCINGTGILNSWLRKNMSTGMSYDAMNEMAVSIPVGSEGLTIIGFGNGAERIMENRNIGAHIVGLDYNRHTRAHVFRAAQEGIVFSMKYGIDIMTEIGLHLTVIRAGLTNMFLSPIFRQTLANITGASIELYQTDGAEGAARGAALGAKLYTSTNEAFHSLKKISTITPDASLMQRTLETYHRWLSVLKKVQ